MLKRRDFIIGAGAASIIRPARAQLMTLGIGQGDAGGGNPLIWSPTDHNSSITISGGGLIATRNSTLGGGQVNARSDTSQSSGTRTVFFTILQIGSGGTGINVGLANGAQVLNTQLGESANSVAYRSGFGSIRINATSSVASPGNYTTGDVLGMIVDFTAKTVKFNKNGGAYNSTTDITILGANLFVACGLNDGTTFASVSVSG